MKRLFAILPLIVLAAIAGVAVYLLTRDGGRAEHFEPRLGRAAPNYELARLDGDGAVTPADLAGRTYVINLFASWCAPCRVEHPVLMRLRGEGATILGVAYKDQPAASERLLADLGNPFAIVALDPEGRFGLDLGVTAVPETFVIGPDGRIRAAHRGALTDDIVERVIRPALQD